MSFIYGLKMNDGSSYASSLVSRYSKSLEDDAKQDSKYPHDEPGSRWLVAGRLLKTAMITVKEDPPKVLDRVAGLFWPQPCFKISPKYATRLIDMMI
jgi:hypothetical protein